MTRRAPQNRDFRVILPKKGRLRDDFSRLCEQAALSYCPAGDRLDYGILRDTENSSEARADMTAEALAQRASDAITTIRSGAADMAVVGLDSYEEARCSAMEKGQDFPLRISRAFNLSACALKLAAPPTLKIETSQDLAGLTIATSFPSLLRAWLRQQNVRDVAIYECDGGVEDSVRLGLADLVCDLVDTGNTLKANNLVPSLTLLESSAVLVERKGTWSAEQTAMANKLRDRLSGTESARNSKAAARYPDLPARDAVPLYEIAGAAI